MRFFKYGLAAAIVLALGAVAYSQSTFTSFITGAPAASVPMGATDYVPVTQGTPAVTKKVAGNNFALLPQIANFTNVLSDEIDQNGSTVFRLKNTSSGGLATALTVLDNGTDTMQLGIAGTGYNPSGIISSHSGYIYAGSPAGISIVAPTGPIIIAAGGAAQVGKWTAAGLETKNIKTDGTTSGNVTIQSSTGSYNFNLPTTAGTSGQVLASGGGSTNPMTWTSLAAVATSGSAADLSTGTLPSGRISGSYTGLTGTGTLTAGATGAGFTIDLSASTINGTLPSSKGGAGTINGILKANGSGTVSAALAGIDYAAANASVTVAGQSCVLGSTCNFNATALSDGSAKTSWTPTISFAGATTGITYTTQSGTWWKVGGENVAYFHILLSSKGSATGNVRINLPFTCTNDDANQGAFALLANSMSSLAGPIMSEANPGQTYASVRSGGATGTSGIDNTNFTNTSELAGQVRCY